MDAADQNQFELNEDQLAIQDMARAFASDRVAPYALQWDRENISRSIYCKRPGRLAWAAFMCVKM